MIAHILKNPFKHEEIFYDALEYQDLPVDEVFEATYNYGPKEEQIIKINIIVNWLQTLICRLVQSYIFPGSCKKLDDQRLVKTKHQLKAIGGRVVSLKTPDGDILEAVHLNAYDFKKSIEKYFVPLEEKETKFQSLDKFFTLKSRFCIKKSKKNIFSYNYLVPNKEAEQFIEHLRGLKFASWSSEAPFPVRGQSALEKGKDFFTSFFYSKIRGPKLGLHSFPIEKAAPVISKNSTSNPTVIICGGNNSCYGSYKGYASFFLTKGMNVILFNPRGYGKSTGIPTSHKTNLDLETVYQYLSKEKKVSNEDILVYGHCLGGGLSTDLVARRAGINIIVDRSFSNLKDLIKSDAEDLIHKKVEKITQSSPIYYKISKYLINQETVKNFANLISKAISYSVDYDNIKNLNKARGNIAFVIDEKDDVIPMDHQNKQRNFSTKNRVITTKSGHNNPWIDTDDKEVFSENYDKNVYKASAKFNEILLQFGFYRKIF